MPTITTQIDFCQKTSELNTSLIKLLSLIFHIISCEKNIWNWLPRVSLVPKIIWGSMSLDAPGIGAYPRFWHRHTPGYLFTGWENGKRWLIVINLETITFVQPRKLLPLVCFGLPYGLDALQRHTINLFLFQIYFLHLQYLLLYLILSTIFACDLKNQLVN